MFLLLIQSPNTLQYNETMTRSSDIGRTGSWGWRKLNIFNHTCSLKEGWQVELHGASQNTIVLLTGRIFKNNSGLTINYLSRASSSLGTYHVLSLSGFPVCIKAQWWLYSLCTPVSEQVLLLFWGADFMWCQKLPVSRFNSNSFASSHHLSFLLGKIKNQSTEIQQNALEKQGLVAFHGGYHHQNQKGSFQGESI